MRARLAVFVILGVSAVFGLIMLRQFVMSKDLPHAQFVDRKVQLLTYSTFAGSYGPAGELIKQFHKDCRCKVEVTAVDDAGLMLERLKLARFDVVVGLDQLMLEDARQQAWQPLEPEEVPWHPEVAPLVDPEFVPFDWSPMSFVYRKDGKPVPGSFDEMLNGEYRKQFALQDPRASSPGLQFLNWTRAVKGAGTEDFLRGFQANVHSVSPSWSFAYGLFKKGQARFAFSYLTSLAYHWGHDKQMEYQILEFPEGHPVQVEFAAVPASCRECELGADFIRHMLEPESQRVIMEKNFMLPAVNGVEKGTVFADLPRLKTVKAAPGKDLREWERVFRK